MDSKPTAMQQRREAIVRDRLQGLMQAIPDLRALLGRLRHTDDAVLIEGQITGTHDREWQGIPATGRRIEFPVVAIFEFEQDRLVFEKVFYDSATIHLQIGALPAEV
jgi:steroid delta-isomerase-like uncharacterized protein